jgi:Na+/phosphate symporter
MNSIRLQIQIIISVSFSFFRLLELASNSVENLIEIQEFFDIIAAMSENPIGRDIVWNFYRHTYRDLLAR